MNKTLITAIALLISGSAFAGPIKRAASNMDADKCQKIKIKKLKIKFNNKDDNGGPVLKEQTLTKLGFKEDGDSATGTLELPVTDDGAIVSPKVLAHCKKTLNKTTIGETRSPKSAHDHKRAVFMIEQMEDSTQDDADTATTITKTVGPENVEVVS